MNDGPQFLPRAIDAVEDEADERSGGDGEDSERADELEGDGGDVDEEEELEAVEGDQARRANER